MWKLFISIEYSKCVWYQIVDRFSRKSIILVTRAFESNAVPSIHISLSDETSPPMSACIAGVRSPAHTCPSRESWQNYHEEPAWYLEFVYKYSRRRLDQCFVEALTWCHQRRSCSWPWRGRFRPSGTASRPPRSASSRRICKPDYNDNGWVRLN